MADTRPSKTVTRGTLSTTYRLFDRDDGGVWTTVLPKGIEVTEMKKMPPDESEPFPAPSMVFAFRAAQRGAYPVDFVRKNADTGESMYSVSNIFEFKRPRFLFF